MEIDAPAAAAPRSSVVSPRQDVWHPLPPSQWNAGTARHLLRRAAWSAQPEEIERAVAEGLEGTLERLFPARATPFPRPASIDKLQDDAPEYAAKLRAASPDEKRAIQKEQRERAQQAQQDMTIKWLQFAARPGLSAQEKWTLFLSDIYVVSFEKVRNPAFMHLHHALIRQFGFGPAPLLAKAMSRSPAMIRYLDLQESKKDAPNENFARELFELFTLGEGHYTEQDIKQAARAFTGYRVIANPNAARPRQRGASGARRYENGHFAFDARQHDDGEKKIFGRKGRYNGDGVIDIVFTLPAAAEFVPREMARFYLSDEPLPPAHIAALGAWWAEQKHDLRALAHRFFGSRLFYDARHTGNFIKSPMQFYLGLVQDLRLDIAPIPRQTVAPLRQMGQMPFQPPNVRGWVGGRSWINSATLAARRSLVQNLFSPINEASLNADELIAITDARAGGRGRFTVDRSRLQHFEKMPPAAIADVFLKTMLAGSPPRAYRDEVIKFLTGNGKPAQQPARIRNTAISLLQSPEYQLC